MIFWHVGGTIAIFRYVGNSSRTFRAIAHDIAIIINLTNSMVTDNNNIRFTLIYIIPVNSHLKISSSVYSGKTAWILNNLHDC